jgi:hypothetical protein
LAVGVAATTHRGMRHAVSGLAHVGHAGAASVLAAGHAIVALGPAVGLTTRRQLNYLRQTLLRTATTTALSGFATGLVLVLIGTGFLGRSARPPERTAPAAAVVVAKPAPSEVAQAKPPNREMASKPVSVVAERAPGVVVSQSTSLRRGVASKPAAAAQQAAAPPATSALEVVAIRFGVVDRKQPDWTWSWRITVHKPNDAVRANARIEYIEFQGSTRRVVGYEEFCGLRLASGQVEAIEGIRIINAADSRRISTITATISPAGDGAEPTTCRPTGGRLPTTRGATLGALVSAR